MAYHKNGSTVVPKGKRKSKGPTPERVNIRREVRATRGTLEDRKEARMARRERRKRKKERLRSRSERRTGRLRSLQWRLLQ